MYHEMMLKNRTWEYAAHVPSRGSIDDLTKYNIDQLKEHTCNMRYGKCNKSSINLHFAGNMSSDEVFLPHWREFINALSEHQYTLKCLPKESESSFDLQGMKLGVNLLDEMSNALQSTQFTSLALTRNNLSCQGIKTALNYMRHNPILGIVPFNRNMINYRENALQLCAIVKAHHFIENLRLDGCLGVEINGYEFLCSILVAWASKLKNVDFGCNRERSNGSTLFQNFWQKIRLWRCLQLRTIYLMTKMLLLLLGH